MRIEDDSRLWIPAFDELGEELERVARAEAPTRNLRRWWAVGLAALSLVAAPTAFALTSDNDDDDVVPRAAPGSPEALNEPGADDSPRPTLKAP